MNLKLILIAICGVIFTLNIMTINDAQAQFKQEHYRPSKKKQAVPEFRYQTMSGEDFSNVNLDKEKRLMIVYFNPVCEICQREIGNIMDNINFFQDIQILMVTPAPMEEVLKFNKKFKFDNYHQITLLYDRDDVFYKQFGAVGYPTVYLFDRNKDMIVYYDTEVEFEEIRDAFSPEMARKR